MKNGKMNNMELEFKKFKIISDKKQYILRYEGEKRPKNYYYSDLLSLLKALPDKALLKNEAAKVDELIQELQELKKFIDSNFKK